MALFEWSDIYSVGLEEIDAQHQQLFRIANNYHEAFSNNADRNILLPTFDELLKYTQYHFGDEERIIEKCRFPETPQHHANHEKLLKLVLSYKKQFDDGTPGIEQQCMEFIKMWLNAHILGADKKYSSYVSRKAA